VGEGWVVREYCGEQHVMPHGELHHFFHCSCIPDIEPNGVIVHHSFDRREEFETGARKPS
jgi:hypothetical protein